jgi:hypothetical protein
VKLCLCGCRRSDRTLQTLAYKLVPGLYQTEMQRRREFGAGSGNSSDLQADPRFFSPEDSISLSLEYYDRLVADQRTGNSTRRINTVLAHYYQAKQAQS